MKRINYTALFSIILLLAVLAASCDRINPPYTEEDTPGPIDTTKYMRKILLEEYTGFRCKSCPRAHDHAEELKENYGKRLVLLSVHAGSFAKPDANHTYDFRTEAGNALNTFFGVIANPTGMISRKSVEDNKVLFDDKWESIIISMLEDTPKVMLDISPEYDAANRRISVEVTAKYLTGSSSNDYLCVFMVEDSIIQYQTDERKTPSDIYDYVHMNVMRGSMNGAWGDPLSATAINAGAEIKKEYTYTIPAGKDWKPENMKIIAFVHDNKGSYEIWQVEEAELIK